MAGIKKRLGSLLGPEGRAPQLTEGTTTQVEAGAAAEISVVKTGDAAYRVDAKIPKGVDGDPSGITDLGNAMASAINTDGSAPNTALKAQSVQAVGGRMVFTDDPTITVPDGTLVVHYQGPRQWTENFADGLYGLTPRWAARDQWTWGGGDAIIPADPSASQTGTHRFLSFDALGANETAVEVLMEGTVTRDLQFGQGGLLLRGDPYSKTGFYATPYADGFIVGRWIDGSFQTIKGIGTGTHTVGAPYLIRFQVGQMVGESERIRAKAWPASATEPTEWQLDEGIALDSIKGPGMAGLYSSAKFFGSEQRWHRVAIATQGETAVFS